MSRGQNQTAFPETNFAVQYRGPKYCTGEEHRGQVEDTFELEKVKKSQTEDSKIVMHKEKSSSVTRNQMTT